MLAVAWEMRCSATVTKSTEWMVRQDGDKWRPREGEFVKRAAQAGGTGPFAIEIDNDVPRSRGLGSSSAVATAVAAAAFRAGGVEPSDEELFAIVTGLEGHADNAAAAVFGGLVMVDGLNHARLPLSEDLAFVAAVPASPLKTAEARSALREHVGRPAVVRSLARFGFLLRGLETGDPALLARARGDEVHEAPRASLSPITGELIEVALKGGALHASWSGAGPTVLAIAHRESVAEVQATLEKAIEGRGEVWPLQVATEGWR